MQRRVPRWRLACSSRPHSAVGTGSYNSEVTYRGHIRNGVVVFDVGVALPEGTAVSVEPLGDGTPSPGTPQAVLEVAGTWQGDASEINQLLDELRRDKWAEVDAERQR